MVQTFEIHLLNCSDFQEPDNSLYRERNRDGGYRNQYRGFGAVCRWFEKQPLAALESSGCDFLSPENMWINVNSIHNRGNIY